MKTQTITFVNEFHGTEINIRAEVGLSVCGGSPDLFVSKRQHRRIREALCPSSECQCTNSAVPQRNSLCCGLASLSFRMSSKSRSVAQRSGNS